MRPDANKDVDQSLMALALRIVGMRMGGRIEDVKDVRSRLVHCTSDVVRDLVNM